MTTTLDVPRVMPSAATRKATTMPGRAFDAIAAFDEHGSALLGYAVNALHDRALAEDSVQETFLRAWRARDAFDPERGSERTWLFTIMRSVLSDAMRARGRSPLLADAGLPPDVETRDADPLERLGLTEALAALSDEHRAIVVAVHLEGLSYQEVSDRTDVPVATLRTRAFYALRSLRAHLTAGEGS